MNFDERLKETQAKMDELKAKINETVDAKNADRKAKRASAIDTINAFVSDPDAFDKIFGKANEKIAVKIDEGIDAVDHALHTAAKNAVETVDGEYFSAVDNIELKQESYESKLNSSRLEIQMRLEAARDKIAQKRKNVDKAVQEELIADLLDYADDCQALAYSYTMEAELAIMDACDLIDDYEEQYGKE